MVRKGHVKITVQGTPVSLEISFPPTATFEEIGIIAARKASFQIGEKIKVGSISDGKGLQFDLEDIVGENNVLVIHPVGIQASATIKSSPSVKDKLLASRPTQKSGRKSDLPRSSQLLAPDSQTEKTQDRKIVSTRPIPQPKRPNSQASKIPANTQKSASRPVAPLNHAKSAPQTPPRPTSVTPTTKPACHRLAASTDGAGPDLSLRETQFREARTTSSRKKQQTLSPWSKKSRTSGNLLEVPESPDYGVTAPSGGREPSPDLGISSRTPPAKKDVYDVPSDNDLAPPPRKIRRLGGAARSNTTPKFLGSADTAHKRDEKETDGPTPSSHPRSHLRTVNPKMFKQTQDNSNIGQEANPGISLPTNPNKAPETPRAAAAINGLSDSPNKPDQPRSQNHGSSQPLSTRKPLRMRKPILHSAIDESKMDEAALTELLRQATYFDEDSGIDGAQEDSEPLMDRLLDGNNQADVKLEREDPNKPSASPDPDHEQGPEPAAHESPGPDSLAVMASDSTSEASSEDEPDQQSDGESEAESDEDLKSQDALEAEEDSSSSSEDEHAPGQKLRTPSESESESDSQEEEPPGSDSESDDEMKLDISSNSVPQRQVDDGSKPEDEPEVQDEDHSTSDSEEESDGDIGEEAEQRLESDSESSEDEVEQQPEANSDSSEGGVEEKPGEAAVASGSEYDEDTEGSEEDSDEEPELPQLFSSNGANNKRTIDPPPPPAAKIAQQTKAVSLALPNPSKFSSPVVGILRKHRPENIRMSSPSSVQGLDTPSSTKSVRFDLEICGVKSVYGPKDSLERRRPPQLRKKIKPLPHKAPEATLGGVNEMGASVSRELNSGAGSRQSDHDTAAENGLIRQEQRDILHGLEQNLENHMSEDAIEAVKGLEDQDMEDVAPMQADEVDPDDQAEPMPAQERQRLYDSEEEDTLPARNTTTLEPEAARPTSSQASSGLSKVGAGGLSSPQTSSPTKSAGVLTKAQRRREEKDIARAAKKQLKAEMRARNREWREREQREHERLQAELVERQAKKREDNIQRDKRAEQQRMDALMRMNQEDDAQAGSPPEARKARPSHRKEHANQVTEEETEVADVADRPEVGAERTQGDEDVDMPEPPVAEAGDRAGSPEQVPQADIESHATENGHEHDGRSKAETEDRHLTKKRKSKHKKSARRDEESRSKRNELKEASSSLPRTELSEDEHEVNGPSSTLSKVHGEKQSPRPSDHDQEDSDGREVIRPKKQRPRHSSKIRNSSPESDAQSKSTAIASSKTGRDKPDLTGISSVHRPDELGKSVADATHRKKHSSKRRLSPTRDGSLVQEGEPARKRIKASPVPSSNNPKRHSITERPSAVDSANPSHARWAAHLSPELPKSRLGNKARKRLKKQEQRQWWIDNGPPTAKPDVSTSPMPRPAANTAAKEQPPKKSVRKKHSLAKMPKSGRREV